MADPDHPAAAIEAVRRQTTEDQDLEREDWQKAVYLNGLLAVGTEPAVETATRWVRRAVETQTSDGDLAYGPMDRGFQMRQRSGSGGPGWWSRTLDDRFLSQTNPAAVGYSVLGVHRLTGDAALLEAAQRQAHRLLGGLRTSDGALAQYRGMPYLFIDGLYMMCPFLVRLGAITGDVAVQEAAAEQLRLYRERLLDPRTRLHRHVWCERPDHFPQSAYWARGNGWLMAAAADVAGEPDADPGVRAAFAEAGRELAAALAPHQDGSGFWRNVLDDPASWLETSGTALTVYGMARGVRDGWLDASYSEHVERARAALAGSVSPDGRVLGVAAVPGGMEVGTEVNPTGQGAWLLAMSELFRRS